MSHLIDGTTGERTERHVPGFGDFFIDKLRPVQVEEWKVKIAGLIADPTMASRSVSEPLSLPADRPSLPADD